jgi:hypothetical protein
MSVGALPRYRFPPAIISHAVWLYYRFTLSFREVEDLLAQRGITVSYDSIRHWCEIFGAAYAAAPALGGGVLAGIVNASCAGRRGRCGDSFPEAFSLTRVEPIAPRPVAFVSGRALPFGERCTIFEAEGGSHMEMYARDAFAISYPHNVKLRVNHNDRSSIPCSLVFSIKRDGLDFVASLPDSPQAKALLARADDIRGVSIEAIQHETVPDPALGRRPWLRDDASRARCREHHGGRSSSAWFERDVCGCAHLFA